MAIATEGNTTFTGQPFSVEDGCQRIYCNNLDEIRAMFIELSWIYVSEHNSSGRIVTEFGICNNAECKCSGSMEYWSED